MSTTLVIFGRLPWNEPAPLRFARWSDLLRARPMIERTEPDPRADHAALLAAHHALTARVERVMLADPARLGSMELQSLTRLGAPCELVLVTDPFEAAALQAALQAVDPPGDTPILGVATSAPPDAFKDRWYTAGPDGTFTPPGVPRRFKVDGALLAAPLVLGASSSLGPWAALNEMTSNDRDKTSHDLRLQAPDAHHLRLQAPDAHHLRLKADVRGAVRLATRPPRALRATPPAEPSPPPVQDRATAMALAALEPALRAVTDRHAFAARDFAATRTAWLRDAGHVLDDARARGLITAWTAELNVEGGQLVADVRVRTARRVEAVVLRLGPMEPSH